MSHRNILQNSVHITETFHPTAKPDGSSQKSETKTKMIKKNVK